MMPSPKRESWLRRKRGSGVPSCFGSLLPKPRLLAPLLCALLCCALTSWGPLSLRAAAAPVKGPRLLVISLPGASWSDLHEANAPNLHDLMANGSIGLMPVAKPSDPDPYRTWATLGAGRAAAGATDLPELQARNVELHTGADVGLLGTALQSTGIPTLYLADSYEEPSPGAVVFAARNHLPLGRAEAVALGMPVPARLMQIAADKYRFVFLDLHSVEIAGRARPPDTKHALALIDATIGMALDMVRPYGGQVLVISPVSPPDPNPDRRSLGPVISYDLGGTLEGGLLTSPSTRTPGLVTAADFAPTVLAALGIDAGPYADRMSGRAMRVQPSANAFARLNRIDAMLSDRYLIRVPVAALYVLFGLVIVVFSLLLAFLPSRKLAFAGAPALALAAVPIGLSIAAPVPAKHDVVYYLVAAAAAGVIGFSAARAGRRRPAFGLALGMLLPAALIVSDVLNGSPGMRFSALEMGVMMGSRFYGIGNEYMGALVGLTTIGLGAIIQLNPTRGRLAALLAVFVTLVIGLGCWGANWGGSITAAIGFVALWLLCLPRIKARHLAAGLLLIAASIIVPGLLDLLAAPENRSHIGVSAAALLSGHADGLLDTIARKLAIILKVIRFAPWSVGAALLCAVVFWLQLRAGAPARRALAGQRALTAGIVAALIAGAAAMVVNDSGPAAGFGAILAALGAVVFLATGAPEPAP